MEEMMKDTQAAQSAAQPTAGAQAEKKPRFSLPKGKKGKKWLKILIAVALWRPSPLAVWQTPRKRSTAR